MNRFGEQCGEWRRMAGNEPNRSCQRLGTRKMAGKEPSQLVLISGNWSSKSSGFQECEVTCFVEQIKSK